MIMMSSANRRWLMYSPLILMPSQLQSKSLKISSSAAVNSFGEITSPCLTPRCSPRVPSIAAGGVPDLGVSTTDPLVITEATSQTKDLKTVFKDSTTEGAHKFVVDGVDYSQFQDFQANLKKGLKEHYEQILRSLPAYEYYEAHQNCLSEEANQSIQNKLEEFKDKLYEVLPCLLEHIVTLKRNVELIFDKSNLVTVDELHRKLQMMHEENPGCVPPPIPEAEAEFNKLLENCQPPLKHNGTSQSFN